MTISKAFATMVTMHLSFFSIQHVKFCSLYFHLFIIMLTVIDDIKKKKNKESCNLVTNFLRASFFHVNKAL